MQAFYQKLFILFFFFHLGYTLEAQNNYIDSLRNDLALHQERDTMRVLILNDLIYELHQIDLDEADVWIKESEDIIKQLNYTKGEAQLFYYKTYIDVAKSDYPKAIENGKEAVKLYKLVDNKKGLSYALNSIGGAYYYQSDYTNAIAYFKESVEIDKELNDLAAVGTGIDNIGSIYANQGNYTEALYHYNQSKEIKESINDSSGIARFYNNVGTIYAEQGNYPKAIENFNKSLILREKLHDEYAKTTVLYNIAAIYQFQKNYEKSLSYFNSGLKTSREFNDKRDIAKYLNGIGSVYKDQLKYEEALSYFNEALEISKPINVRSEIAESLINIASIQIVFKNDVLALDYYNQALEISKEIESPIMVCWSYLGIANTYVFKKQFSKALDFALQAEKIAIKHEWLDSQRDAKELMSTIYGSLEDYQKALSSHKQFKLLDDSLFNKRNIEEVTQLEYEYKYKQEIEAASVREQTLTKTVTSTTQDLEKSQRNSFIAIISILLLCLVSGGFIFFLKLKQVQAENKNIRIQQKLLRSQMTPHFIFNSLSILQGLILNKEENKSMTYLSQFSKLLRMTLENSRHKTVLLSNELAAIESYMALQNLDTDPPYKFTINIEDEIKNMEFNIPPMLIQPFIENAVEHAFVNQIETKEINLNVSFNNKQLLCKISDNGIGINNINENTKKNKSSLATAITSERLEILAEDFKMPGTLKIENRSSYSEQGTLVSLIVPYKINLKPNTSL